MTKERPKKRYLYVVFREDEEEDRQALYEELKKRGFHVTIATTSSRYTSKRLRESLLNDWPLQALKRTAFIYDWLEQHGYSKSTRSSVVVDLQRAGHIKIVEKGVYQRIA